MQVTAPLVLRYFKTNEPTAKATIWESKREMSQDLGSRTPAVILKIRITALNAQNQDQDDHTPPEN
ncbi:hypothetical protein PspLS_08953 [Pyricularia sp. CBS 133598]|nr:hypothetical protein PspLS_08953 [Pyricularia sp. CBS 133598]